MLTMKMMLGLAALLLAWIFLFRREVIFKANAWLRDNVINDRVVLFSGRRVAILLVLLGGISLFSGIEDVIEVQRVQPHVASKIIEEARDDFQRGRFHRAINRSRELVRRDAKNIGAWEILVLANRAIGDQEAAKQALDSLLRLEPDHELGRMLATPVGKKKQDPLKISSAGKGKK
jgi:tetratricopeptide (TPR) repeat protein